MLLAEWVCTIGALLVILLVVAVVVGAIVDYERHKPKPAEAIEKAGDVPPTPEEAERNAIRKFIDKITHKGG